MNTLAKSLTDRLASWPDEDVAELEELAREIESRRTGVYVLSDEEWADLQEGLRQADRKEFATAKMIANADKRHGT